MEYKMTKFPISTLISLLTFTVTAYGHERIVGGSDAPSIFGLFHASLQNLTGHHICGGAVVSKLHVLTAAHCLYGADPDHIKVVGGTTDLKKGGLQYDVHSISIFKGFNYTSKVNDIALLTVKEPFDLKHIKVIELHNENLTEGDLVFLAGFGAKKIDGESSNQMQVLFLPVFSQSTCEYAMRYTREITNDMFCTFTKIGQGTCNGDSGSPIIKNEKLVGLVSWGIPCARGFPDVHTRIQPFIPWIISSTRNDICYLTSTTNKSAMLKRNLS